MANRNFPNQGRLYSGHVMPVQVDCSFIVAATDSGGLGITSLKGPLVQNVFMHTSATPGAGASNSATPGIVITNPNPANGTVVVQLQDTYNYMFAAHISMRSPNGSNQIITSGLTAGVAYTITILGDATAADWLAIGVPAGLTPAVGLSFIAASTGHGASASARVAPSAAAGSNVFSVEHVGNPNQSIGPSIAAQGFGSQVILQFRKSTSDASAIQQPADGSIINLTFMLSNSSVNATNNSL